MRITDSVHPSCPGQEIDTTNTLSSSKSSTLAVNNSAEKRTKPQREITAKTFYYIREDTLQNKPW